MARTAVFLALFLTVEISAYALDVDADYISTRKWMLTFSLESSNDGKKEVGPPPWEIQRLVSNWPSAEFWLARGTQLVYSEPNLDHGGDRELPLEEKRRMLRAVCSFFQHMSPRNAPAGEGAQMGEKPRDSIRIQISLSIPGLSLSYDTKYIPKTAELPRDLLALLKVMQKYCPDWSRDLVK